MPDLQDLPRLLKEGYHLELASESLHRSFLWDFGPDVLKLVELNDFVMRVLRLAASMDDMDELHWRTDAEFAPITFLVGCNDVFWWATGDAERVTKDNVADLIQAVADCAELGDGKAYSPEASFGPLLFCARQRKMRPQGAYYPHIYKVLWPLFDACGPERPPDFNNPHARPAE